jgi:hypothetical protein
MNYSWSDTGLWIIVLLLCLAGLAVLDFLRSWWDYERRKDKLIEEIRKRREK